MRHGTGERLVWIFLFIHWRDHQSLLGRGKDKREDERDKCSAPPQPRWCLRKAVIYLRIIGQYNLTGSPTYAMYFPVEKYTRKKEPSSTRRFGFAGVLWGDPLSIYCIWQAHISTDPSLEATDRYQHLICRVSRWNIQSQNFLEVRTMSDCWACLVFFPFGSQKWYTHSMWVDKFNALSSLMQISMNEI